MMPSSPKEWVMTQQDLDRWQAELAPLVPLGAASPTARENALRFNADASDVEVLLLSPARRLLEGGSPLEDLAPCLEQVVVELAFWRRVLLGVHRQELGGDASRPELLVGYLLS
jgi:hypothetical protein